MMIKKQIHINNSGTLKSALHAAGIPGRCCHINEVHGCTRTSAARYWSMLHVCPICIDAKLRWQQVFQLYDCASEDDTCGPWLQYTMCHTYKFVLPTSTVTPNISCACIASLTLATKQKQLIHCGCGTHLRYVCSAWVVATETSATFQNQLSNPSTKTVFKPMHSLTHPCILYANSVMQAVYQILYISASLGTCTWD